MPVMSFDLEDGKPPVSFSINNEGAERFMDFMAECQAIRDSVKQPDSERDAARYHMMKENDFTIEYSDYIKDCLNGREHVDLDAIVDAMAAQQGEKGGA